MYYLNAFKLRPFLVTKFVIAILCILSTIILLFLPFTASAYQENKSSSYLLSHHLLGYYSPIISPSPTSSTSDTISTQEQQILSEAQNDVSIANTIITYSGYFFAIVALAVTVAGLFGIRELRSIQRLRVGLESDIKQINDTKQLAEGQLKTLTDNFENQRQVFENLLGQLTQRFESEQHDFEIQLKKLSEEFENQKIMEAAYDFYEAKNAYTMGNNERAVEYFLRVLKAQPKNTGVMERLGRAYSNLDETEKATYYLNEALVIDPSNVPALRSLALCYRYIDRERAIRDLKSALAVAPHDYEAWDFLGLLYRDQGLTDEAIFAHEKALKIEVRPETEFYLSILYCQKGDKEKAKLMAQRADQDTHKREHDERLRPVWKVLIHCGVFVFDDDEKETLRLIQTLTPYLTTKRTYDAVIEHLQSLLNATGHSVWISKFMPLKEI